MSFTIRKIRGKRTKWELLNRVQKTWNYVGISSQIFGQEKREDYYEII